MSGNKDSRSGLPVRFVPYPFPLYSLPLAPWPIPSYFCFLYHLSGKPLKEYGSSIQKLVDNMVNIEDRSTRTRYAHILIELMRQIHPNMKDGQDYYNKLWDDLYIMSNFTLDVDSPYPPPSEEALGKKPQRVPYNTHNLKFKHFGRNVDLLIAKAVSLEEPEERRTFVSYLTRLMRTFYQAWNKESVEDETIYQSLIELSNGKLYNDIQLIRTEGLVEATPRERTGDQPQRVGGNNYRNDRNRTEGGIGQQGRSNNRNDRDGGGPRNINNRNRNDGGQQGRPNNRNDRNDGSQRNFGHRNRNDRDGGPRDGGGSRDSGPRDGNSRNDGPPRRRR